MLWNRDDADFEVLALKAFTLMELLSSASDSLAALNEQAVNTLDLHELIPSAGLVAEEVHERVKDLAERRREANARQVVASTN